MAVTVSALLLQEPATQPWGVRDCVFRDPSGDLVRIQARPRDG